MGTLSSTVSLPARWKIASQSRSVRSRRVGSASFGSARSGCGSGASLPSCSGRTDASTVSGARGPVSRGSASSRRSRRRGRTRQRTTRGRARARGSRSGAARPPPRRAVRGADPRTGRGRPARLRSRAVRAPRCGAQPRPFPRTATAVSFASSTACSGTGGAPRRRRETPITTATAVTSTRPVATSRMASHAGRAVASAAATVASRNPTAYRARTAATARTAAPAPSDAAFCRSSKVASSTSSRASERVRSTTSCTSAATPSARPGTAPPVEHAGGDDPEERRSADEESAEGAPATGSACELAPLLRVSRHAAEVPVRPARQTAQHRHNGRFMATVEEKAGSGGSGVSDGMLRGFFREMLLIRRFEEKVEERFRAGELPGFLHVAIGQEATATGVCAALQREDVIASTHRAHGHAIAKGVAIDRVMAELYGKKEGCSGGFGGSMHLYDVEVGLLGANAVVAGGIPAVVGSALAFQMKGEQRVAVAFFGDGATNAGTFHESLNLAQLWKVPAVFVLENNGWAESTPAVQHSPLPVDELGKRALAYGMKLIEVDGQDVELVYLAALASREHALSGKGPVLLHLRTHRLTGHYVGDPQVYRDKEELKRERETKDPIELLRSRLELPDEEFAAIDSEVTAEVEAAVEFAKAGTDPDPEDAL